MKQIIQDLKSGATVLEEVPVPQVKGGINARIVGLGHIKSGRMPEIIGKKS